MICQSLIFKPAMIKKMLLANVPMRLGPCLVQEFLSRLTHVIPGGIVFLGAPKYDGSVLVVVVVVAVAVALLLMIFVIMFFFLLFFFFFFLFFFFFFFVFFVFFFFFFFFFVFFVFFFFFFSSSSSSSSLLIVLLAAAAAAAVVVVAAAAFRDLDRLRVCVRVHIRVRVRAALVVVVVVAAILVDVMRMVEDCCKYRCRLFFGAAAVAVTAGGLDCCGSNPAAGRMPEMIWTWTTVSHGYMWPSKRFRW